ncbi:cupin domain-containing protein [Scytonema sp. PRP1]|uniref:cupin domain-containing protein n=1 Tax=Scytonema sp. PRP1 TaxID=3120513 RepID=UPI002FD186D4
MDVLSDVLRVIRLSGGVRFRTEYFAPWSIETPPPDQLAVLLQAASRRIVSFHIVAEGTCWVEIDGCSESKQLSEVFQQLIKISLFLTKAYQSLLD